MDKIPFKAVGIDIDGLLIRTEHLQYQAWVKSLEELNAIDLSPDEYKDYYVGNSSSFIAEKLGERYPTINVSELYELREEYIRALVDSADFETMPYAEDALEYFGSEGIRMVLVTGAFLDESDVKLRKAGLDRLVEQYNIPVVGRGDVEKGKPAPDSYLAGAKKLKLEPDKGILTFEDTLPGVQSALAAGTTCFAIPNEWTERSEFPKEALRFNNLRDVVDYIHENYEFPQLRRE